MRRSVVVRAVTLQNTEWITAVRMQQWLLDGGRRGAGEEVGEGGGKRRKYDDAYHRRDTGRAQAKPFIRSVFLGK